MRIVAVTRTRNEDDILECFVRHTARLVDHHVILANACSDRTIEILRALHGEGIGLTVLENDAVQFNEIDQNLFFLRYAAGALGADWVLYLDTDEFVDVRRLESGLQGHLAGVDAAVDALRVQMVNYVDTVADDGTELNVLARMRHRQPDYHDVYKVFVRGRLAEQNASVYAGNHLVLIGGKPLATPIDARLLLAHFPRRSPWQQIAKVVIGRLRAEAAGHNEAGFSSHYVEPFALLRDNPAALFGNAAFMAHPAESFVNDPVRYLGGMLAHTKLTDPRLTALASVVDYAERLAKQLGQVMDTQAGARAQLAKLGSHYRKLL